MIEYDDGARGFLATAWIAGAITALAAGWVGYQATADVPSEATTLVFHLAAGGLVVTGTALMAVRAIRGQPVLGGVAGIAATAGIAAGGWFVLADRHDAVTENRWPSEFAVLLGVCVAVGLILDRAVHCAAARMHWRDLVADELAITVASAHGMSLWQYVALCRWDSTAMHLPADRITAGSLLRRLEHRVPAVLAAPREGDAAVSPRARRHAQRELAVLDAVCRHPSMHTASLTEICALARAVQDLLDTHDDGQPIDQSLVEKALRGHQARPSLLQAPRRYASYVRAVLGLHTMP